MTDEDYDDLFDDGLPRLVRGEQLDLATLGGPGAELSTGLVLTWRDRLVFALEPRAEPLGAQGVAGVSAFVGVGGHLEPGEGWGAAATREAVEEANCAVSLGDSAVTYLCRQDQAPSPIAYRWDEPVRPLLVWLATFNLRRGPERQRMPVNFVNAVFRAAALGKPSPGAEVEALVLMDPEILLYAFAAPRPFDELAARGATVIGAAPAPDKLLAPGGSAYFYAQWLAWQETGR
jgi:8-oxo-dGTP pyrophosphatase MutT (NUDIX family)